jgi:hypothetical protein
MNRQYRSHYCRPSFPLHLAFGLVASIGFAAQAQGVDEPPPTLPKASIGVYPDAPSTVLMARASADEAADGDDPGQSKRNTLPPCPSPLPAGSAMGNTPAPPCKTENPLRIVVNSDTRQPLTSRQKGLLAGRDIVDPLNLTVIAAESGFGVGLNSHSAYGPGMKGFGRLFGYDLLQDAQGEVIGTYLIPSLVHEDPRYRRMQNASVKRRIFHALERTIIAEHDDGRAMPNYATLLTYPISAELSNLYVPGVQDNARSTFKRIGIGLATDPASNLIAEFLPDFARRIHVRSVFIQQIVNQVAIGQGVGQL